MSSIQVQVRQAVIPSSGYARAEAAPIWLWALCIFMLSTPFYFILTGTTPDISVARDAATGRRPEGANLGFYLLRIATIALALFLGRSAFREGIGKLARSWPMMLFFAWAFLSLIWSEAPGTTFNGLFSLASLVVVSVLITASLRPNEVVRAILYAGLILGAASIFWSLFVPSQGVHQLSDAGQSVHAGNWRGVFIHKNSLGQTCAMIAVLALFADRASVSVFTKWSVFGLMVLLILLSASGSARVILIAAPVIVIFYVFFPRWMHSFILMAFAILALFLYFFIADILSLLGRDATLTGRTVLWELALSYISEKLFIGYGFMAPYSDFAFQAQRRANVFEPHNGFLDIALGLGCVGLAIFVFALFRALRASRRLYLTHGWEGRGALGLAGLTSAWIIACFAESAARPTGATAALGFLSLGVMTYSGFRNQASLRDGSAVPLQRRAERS
ncbi:O-antigen ligase family protein [Bosea sp. BH3]|uniref:O-antigen ligase family protein n=1 Tax=Bosea sp. BH3 TaxID=2871701 RepID=UPI0021CB61C4|nr:O-antigen ligase family protein [Bosea sp. BH3]MCU4181135.1 O-antigen ligase family protein [Bosea sp. BH3]